MKNEFIYAFLIGVSCLLSCSSNQKTIEQNNVIVQEEVNVPIHYYLLQDIALCEAPQGQLAMNMDSKSPRTITRNGRVEIIQSSKEFPEWVKVKQVDCHPKKSEENQGWVEIATLSEEDPINYYLGIERGVDYKIHHTSSNPVIDNYYIVILNNKIQEDYLVDFSNTLRKKFKKPNKNINIWIYDKEIPIDVLEKWELTDRESIMLADHQVYALIGDKARIGDWYPLQDNYKEYKAKGGRNWKK